MSVTNEIDYAPRRRRRWKRRALIVFVSLASIGFSGYWWGPGAWHRVRTWAAQSMGRWQQPAEGTLVADTQTGQAVRNPDMMEVVYAGRGPGIKAVVAPGSLRCVAVAERVSVQGGALLFVVEGGVSNRGISLGGYLISPAGLTVMPSTVAGEDAFYTAGTLLGLDSWAADTATAGRIRLYAGGVDKADQTRVLIGYEIDGKKGIIGCRVLPPGGGELLRWDILPPLDTP